MFVFDKDMQRVENVDINTKEEITIFTDTANVKLKTWLLEKNFPSQFFEDIENEDQSVIHSIIENGSITIFKYIKFNNEEYLQIEPINVAIIMLENRIIFFVNDRDILHEISHKFEEKKLFKKNLYFKLYAILDILFDNAILSVDVIDEALENMEDKILENDIEEEEIQKNIYFTRRTLNRLYKIFVQEKDVVNRVYNRINPKDRELLKYDFIDLKEHLDFVSNESKTLLDRTGYLLNLHMGIMSNQMNKAMQKLAGISIIFMPLTFIVGNYGMNFDNMPELHTQYGYYVVTAINIIVAVSIFIWLRKKNLI